MAKAKYKSTWFCNECGAESPKWTGKCPECGAWNTMVEERVATTSRTPSPVQGPKSVPVAISDIAAGEETRIKMPSGELNARLSTKT